MREVTKPSRHNNGGFHFLGTEEDSELRGTVLIRDREMVLDIPGGHGPYLIVGKARSHWFEGENSAIGKQYDVNARWAVVGETFIGIWIEGGWEYMFSFCLG